MTEQDWMTSSNPEMLFAVLYDRKLRNERKLTLAGCACFRRHWKSVADETMRRAVEGAEQYVDQTLSQRELNILHKDVERLWERLHSSYRDSLAQVGYAAAATYLSGRVWDENVLANTMRAIVGGLQRKKKAEVLHQLDILRDVIGNPFRPTTINAAWRTAAVLAVSQAIYDERRFADMPILADALEESGCTSADILAHCRNGQEHVRGCWVVDCVLEKS